MSGIDDTQTKINRLSLVMTIPEDIVRACKAAEFPPAMTETLIRLHNQQVELQKAVNELRTTMVDIAKVIDMQATFASTITDQLFKMQKDIGYADFEPTISTEDADGSNSGKSN